MSVRQTIGGGSTSSGGDGAILDGADPAIKASVKDLANSNPLTVAIVDTSGDQIASFGGGTQYTEDAAAAANPVGTALNLVRDDGRVGGLTTTDGDNVAARGTNSGELYVKHVDNITVNAHAVTNAGTFVVQENGAALTSLQLIDDTVFTDDTSTHSTGTTKGIGIMAVATPTDAAVDANDIGMVAMTTSRLLKVDASGVAVPVTDNAGSLTVDYATTGSGNATGALRVELANNGTGVIATVGAVTAITNALPAGTNAIGKLSSNTGVTIGAVEIAAAQTLATVTTVSTLTNQSQEGGVAISLNAGTVDTGTRRVVQAHGAGKTIVSTGGSAAGNGNNTLIAADATKRIKVVAFSLTTVSATAMTCIFQDGASGTELWRAVIMAPAGASSGANLSTTVPGWLFATTANTLLNLNLSSANAVHWAISYYLEV